VAALMIHESGRYWNSTWEPPVHERDLPFDRQAAAAAVSPAVSLFAVQHGSGPPDGWLAALLTKSG